MFEYKKNKAIKEKIYKNGKKSYYFQIYLGKDPQTGKKKITTKRGFKTPALANAAYRKIQTQVLNGTYEITTRSSKTQLNLVHFIKPNKFLIVIYYPTLEI